MPPRGNHTPAIVSMYAITPYAANARFGATPAYSDWNEKIRRSRSSGRNRATLGPSLPNPPRRASRTRSGPSRASGESRLAPMNVSISVR